MDNLLCNYSIEELMNMLSIERKNKENNRYKPFLMEKGVYYHEYKEHYIPNEIFIDFYELPTLKVSNLGRVKYNDIILPQEQESEEKYDYLWVKVPQYKWIKVYELVAKTFLLKTNPNPEKYKIIHHISNNGFDNRIENLMYVTCEQHRVIHNFKSWYCINKLNCDINCQFYNKE